MNLRVLKSILVLSVLFLLGAGIPTDLSGQSAGPRIQFPDSVYHFGTVPMGTVVEHRFRYQNVGDAELVVSGAKPGCGCTRIDFRADTLAPGEWGWVDFRFDTHQRVGREKLSFAVWHNGTAKVTKVRVTGEIVLNEEELEDSPPEQ